MAKPNAGPAEHGARDRYSLTVNAQPVVVGAPGELGLHPSRGMRPRQNQARTNDNGGGPSACPTDACREEFTLHYTRQLGANLSAQRIALLLAGR